MKPSRFTQPTSQRRILCLSVPVGAALLCASLLVWACAGARAAAASPPLVSETVTLNAGKVITIGMAGAMSGPAEALGWRQANAVQLAISQTNAAGGVDIGGVLYTLKMVAADSACDPTQAITAAHTLLDAGAVAVIGHTCSGETGAAQPLYNAAGVPMISPSASANGLTEAGYTTTFRVFPKNDAAPNLMAGYFRRSLGMDAVAVLEWSGTAWSADAFSNTFTSLGGSITSRHTFTSTADYTTTLTAVRAENPDAIYYADYSINNAGLLSSIAHSLGLNIVGCIGDEAPPNDYAAAAGAAAEGDYVGILGRSPLGMPGYNGLNADYQAAGFLHYGDDAGNLGAFAYDAARILIAAIDRSDSADPGAIRDEIAATTGYAGVVGTYTGFDAKGDIIPQWSELEVYQNGQWVTVFPSKLQLPLVLNRSE